MENAMPSPKTQTTSGTFNHWQRRTMLFDDYDKGRVLLLFSSLF
jgi:hypothetical protein